MLNDRQLKIDTLRGLACILLVAYHVIGSDPSNGLKIADGLYRNLNDLLAYVRMPLFTFLSGIVYAYRPCRSDTADFLTKKARRLLIPMITVGTIFVLLQHFTPGSEATVENWYLLHIIPVAHYWFIESLFLVFVLIAFLEKKNLLNGRKTWSLVVACSMVFYTLPIYWPYFSFAGFVYLTPFFLAGMGIQRYGLMENPKKYLALVALFLLAGVFVLLGLGILPMYGQRTLPTLLIGVGACVTLLALGVKSTILARMGVFSYSIYLFHVFFTAFSRIVLNKVGSLPTEVIFVLSLVAGVLGPIMLEKILEKFDWCRVLFLGKAAKKEIRPESPRHVQAGQ
ncbi:acyltransferase family protein [Limnobacter parvus]|uniref:Acyltransferase n=1 Tax=Limnobacter parvus TaxID=2939690 RepID=A0ABT1XG99_9BURK|nr:acyltransferase [Limnobacter parvus]MCR2745929.1 acyltransferase [Limnobacter parvus]